MAVIYAEKTQTAGIHRAAASERIADSSLLMADFTYFFFYIYGEV